MKKSIICLILVAVLALGAGFGTMAYYTKTLSSVNNEITSANFEVIEVGNEWKTIEKIGGPQFAPGKEISFDYNISTGNTEVPVKYVIKVNEINDNGLFNSGSPLQKELRVEYKKNGANIIESVPYIGNNYFEYIPESGIKEVSFYLKYFWPFEGNANDINFAGKKGSVNVSIEVRQIRDEYARNTDGSSMIASINAVNGHYNNLDSVWATIASNNLTGKKLTSFAFVLYNNKNEIIIKTSATPQLLNDINKQITTNGKFNTGNTMLATKNSKLTIREETTDNWNADWYLANDSVNLTDVQKVKAIFTFENDAKIYFAEGLYK